ncbi:MULTISPECIES: DNA cytosine methyltransferase [unclassified Tolypothrix]|uniref:DNA cytosine methyltransferase n=1 Tax=unclassified Tolypothrix TaxID=2649714 RepID=UPI0005EAC688|nr:MULTISPECIES: DNA cytosine methyltransferase [unclassified Tolypothrix]BAY90057.1 site-specific DNA-methyltransferase [Microchaete diplosiphon NIES-3275]EKE98674.1 DNA (cytosine-5-)-methyltransferase [Tolypothrix sp. PCC 7601]MBE9084870.1 DNA cytosine methyltransferase [Tolypothrix sp. LEGE 11397]UYD24280.1 DNA cytosine methyltransferase [Tolypothrix sp. PCC 7712]UYD33489.1 DNA cytosine methyltransferase [Tolypothrix sp. PCC 7601]
MEVPYLSTKEAACKLGFSEQRIRSLLREGILVGQQVGKTWVIMSDSIESYQAKLETNDPSDRKSKKKHGKGIKALSFFSGAMGLDLGLEKSGIEVVLGCEVDKYCRKTIISNRPEIALIGDISSYTTDEILEYAGISKNEVDIIVGGPPCQAFSTAGARRGFNDKRGNVFLKFIEIILDIKPKYAVIENVRGLLSAPLKHRPHAERGENNPPLSIDELPGGALLHIINLLRQGGYDISFNLYNTANYGVPQVRERVVMICHRDGGKVPYLYPTHSENGSFGLPPWQTLRDAISNIPEEEALYVNFPENRLVYYRMLQEGQYWKHLPLEMQKKALGKSYYAGGGKTGFLRRLSWDKPSCTLVTHPAMPATDICHPVLNRPLSVQEYKRIQQFPDNWIVYGSIIDQYRQIGNAVPVGLGEAIGKTILTHMSGQFQHPPQDFPFSRYKNNDDISWEKKTSTTIIKHNLEDKPLSGIECFK